MFLRSLFESPSPLLSFVFHSVDDDDDDYYYYYLEKPFLDLMVCGCAFTKMPQLHLCQCLVQVCFDKACRRSV